ncbi:RteC domain-containing protein [Chitinophaga niabensis]|uniref:RteC protein n=1 Tax=Chitinophaga niabensis TaxID=536979 RepID=A0A1N6KBT2_9BACT|nr:RteC domain-containing protein [Chitinophaga niabensis]SIO53786.1 RteC protein [Chitinophaga niabensis]
MEAFVSELKSSLKNELQLIEQQTDILLDRYRLSAKAVSSIVLQLKDKITNYQFKNSKDEIFFFKKILPDFYSEVIYYSKSFQILTKLSICEREGQKILIREELSSITGYFKEHQELYLYYHLGDNHLDDKYFIRSNEPIQFSYTLFCILDSRFCTEYSCQISNFIAFERVKNDLEIKLALLENQPLSSTVATIPKQLKWKGPKVGLVEFGYASKDAGYLDESFQDIFASFEQLFQIRIENSSRTFQEIIARKKDDPIVMEVLAQKVKQRKEKMNENYTSKK